MIIKDGKEQIITADDIEVRDLPRRKFMLGAGGTVVALSSALSAGCSNSSSDQADPCDADIVADMDPSDPITFVDPCDVDLADGSD